MTTCCCCCCCEVETSLTARGREEPESVCGDRGGYILHRVNVSQLTAVVAVAAGLESSLTFDQDGKQELVVEMEVLLSQ